MISSAGAFFCSLIDTDSVWPSSTATRLHCALIANAPGLMPTVEIAEELARLLLHLFFFFGDVGDYVAQNVHRCHARVSRAADRLHGGDHNGLESEFALKGASASTSPMAEQLGLVTM